MGEFRRVLNDIREIGYQGVGLETRLLPLQAIRDPSLVKKALTNAGVENTGCYSTMKLSDVGWAAKAGTPLLWVVARGEWTFDAASKAVGDLASLAAKSGIDVALHNHLGTKFETEAQLKKVLATYPQMHICYDTAHAEAAGIDQAKFVREYGDRIALMHLKDLRARVPKGMVSFTKDFVNVGDGIVDFAKVFGALRDVGYLGSIMLEIEALGGKQPRALAQEGYQRIQRSLREA